MNTSTGVSILTTNGLHLSSGVMTFFKSVVPGSTSMKISCSFFAASRNWVYTNLLLPLLVYLLKFDAEVLADTMAKRALNTKSDFIKDFIFTIVIIINLYIQLSI